MFKCLAAGFPRDTWQRHTTPLAGEAKILLVEFEEHAWPRCPKEPRTTWQMGNGNEQIWNMSLSGGAASNVQVIYGNPRNETNVFVRRAALSFAQACSSRNLRIASG